MKLRRLAEGVGWFALFGLFVFLRWVAKGLVWLVGPEGVPGRTCGRAGQRGAVPLLRSPHALAPPGAAVIAVSVNEITSGEQLFRCVPYSCTMLTRACVERQAKAALGLDSLTLLKCKGCELGAEVKARAAGVVFTEADLLRGARAAGLHRSGPLGKKLRGARVNPALDAERTAAVATSALPVAQPIPTKEEPMPKFNDLTGKSLAGVKVLRQAESQGKGAVWVVRFPCSHEAEVLGSTLSSYDKNGNKRRCQECDGEPTAAPAARTRAARADEKAPERDRVPTPEAEPQTYNFPLRRSFTASVTLPSDLTRSDVQRFSRWLESLVFEDGVDAAE